MRFNNFSLQYSHFRALRIFLGGGGNKVSPPPPPSPRLPARVCDSINCSYKPRIFVFPHNYNVFQFEVDIRFSLVNFYLLSLLNALIYICKERCPQISVATLAVRWN